MKSKYHKLRISSKFSLDTIFIIMIMLSLLLTYSFFRAWNRPSLSLPHIESYTLKTAHIDSCVFSDKDITVIGWAFTEGNTRILNRIFSKGKNGDWIELMSSTITRGDVSAAFNSPTIYDRSGFIATRKDSSVKESFNRDIMIISFDDKGAGHAAKYHCQ